MPLAPDESPSALPNVRPRVEVTTEGERRRKPLHAAPTPPVPERTTHNAQPVERVAPESSTTPSTGRALQREAADASVAPAAEAKAPVAASSEGAARIPGQRTAGEVGVVPVADASPAESLSAAPEPEQIAPDEVDSHIWELIERDEESLALLLTRQLEMHGERSQLPVPRAELIEIAILTRCGADRPEFLAAFQQRESVLVEQGLEAHEEAVTLYAAGALAARALLATGGEACALLAQLEFQGRAGIMAELRDAIVAFQRFGIALTPELLRGVRTLEAVDAERRRTLEDLVAWRETNRGALMRFARATNVWRAWLRDDGVIGLMIEAAQRGDMQRLRAFVEQWTVAGNYWKEQLRRTDERLCGPGTRSPIEGAVIRHDFPTKLREVHQLCSRLLAACDRLVAPQGSEQLQFHVEEFRRRLRDALRDIRPRLEQIQAEVATDRLRAAATSVSRQVDWIERFLQVESGITEQQLNSQEVLAGDFLRIPGLRLDRSWNVIEAPPLPDLCQLVSVAAGGGLSRLGEVLKAAEERCNIRTLQQALAVAERRRPAEVDWQRPRGRYDQTRERAARLRDIRAQEVETNLERALVENLVPEGHIVEFRARVEAVRNAVGEELELDEIRATLDKIEEDLEARRTERARELNERLLRLELDASLRDRIVAAIQRRDLQVAEELVAAVERGDSLSADNGQRDPFLEFFPQRCQEIQDWLEHSEGWRLLRTALGEKAPATTSIIDLSKVDDYARRQSAGKLIEAWRAVKRFDPGTIADSREASGRFGESVRIILQELGWRVREVLVTSAAKLDNIAWLTAVTDPVRDLPRFIVPHYGSRAGGRYRILCAWNRPPEETLLHLVSSNVEEPNAPVMAFFLGRLSETKRRTLARLSREQRRTVLVLDDVLLAFLTGEPGMRLPTFLACSTPFTTMSPYTTTAGLVDREMFFGRLRDREMIWDLRGAHLLYGGRQLGKTALLRAIERERHNEAKGVIVQWIDLKEEGIGHARSIDDIWVLIASRLRQFSILGRGSPGYDGLRTQIQEWLGRDPGRRILLLLDEADAFLRADATSKAPEHGEGFERVSRLKALMDDTGGRFKVVFAGLHNVQRTARNINSPLAHLGEPICIGPLFGGSDAPSGEAKAALSLVREPMEALGFRFESEDLPLRILAHTNWYPSLTQLFCRELLEHMVRTRSDASRLRQGPPYAVTAKDIEEAYRGQNLRKEILERFRITLDLDRRYRVIALCIAAETVRDRVSGISAGFSLDWIRSQCLYWWEQGFQESRTNEAFRALLDEMVGLGVLRTTSRDRYALRNPNVLNLLGTHEEIDRDLVDAITQEPAAEYEPATFRRAVPGMVWQRSPLTASQESDLLARAHGIRVVFGLAASNLQEVPRFIEMPVPGAEGYILRDLRSQDDFKKRLDQLTDRREHELLVVCVPQSAPWDEGWVQTAAEKLGRARSRRNFIRIAFLADSRRAWSVKEPQISSDVDFGYISLGPWAPVAIRRLLSDLHVSEAAWKVIADATGGWSWYVGKVADELKTGAPGGTARVEDICESLGQQWKHVVTSDLPEQAVPILKPMASYGEPLTAAELLELLDAAHRNPAVVEQVLRWAQRVGVLCVAPGDTFEVDPAFRAVLVQS